MKDGWQFFKKGEHQQKGGRKPIQNYDLLYFDYNLMNGNKKEKMEQKCRSL